MRFQTLDSSLSIPFGIDLKPRTWEFFIVRVEVRLILIESLLSNYAM